MTGKRHQWAIVGVVLGLVGVAVWGISSRGITRGLDMTGGLEVVLKAEPKPGQQVTPQILDEAAAVMRRRIDPRGIVQPEVRTSPSDNTIQVAIPGVKNPDRVSALLRAGDLLNFDMLRYANAVSWDTQHHTVVAAPSAWDLLSRADQHASRGRPTQPVSAWGLFSTRDHQFYRKTTLLPTKSQVLEQARLTRQPTGTTWRFVPAGTLAVSCDTGSVRACAPPGESRIGWYLFNKPPPHQLVTGAEISSASNTTDESGNPIVAIHYKGDGAADFQNVTKGAVITASTRVGALEPGELAMIVDSRLVSITSVDASKYPLGIDASQNGSEISGLSNDEANRIALEIQSGVLPVQFATQSENLVSATLGQAAVRGGLIAGATGLIAVMIFLVVLYGFLGLIADAALLVYGVLLAGIVALMPVTMTLPGIAGAILTIGVAADANVVIFERIKEEVRAGRSVPSAISRGYKLGFRTIIDANVVTLTTAAILYLTTTSGVKGFALMLLIGVGTSMLTAVGFTRAMLELLGGSRFEGQSRLLGTLGTGNRWARFDFVGRKQVWFSISAAVLCAAALSLGIRGLNQGIDFTGGSQLDFKTKTGLSAGQIQAIVQPITGSDTVVRGLVGADQSRDTMFNSFQVQSHFLTKPEQTRLVDTLRSDQVGASDMSFQNVSSSFGRTVLDAAYLAVIFSLGIIFIYIWFRFDWVFGLPVMIALAHDILLTIGIYALSGRAVTANTVAAILTVLGYSIYDTLIVFDRVRENARSLGRLSPNQLVNHSLAQTVARSLNTTFVTLIPVVLLYLFGEGDLKDFAFALLVGIFAGAYSSIFVASPALAMLMNRRRRAEPVNPYQAVPEVAMAMTLGTDGPGFNARRPNLKTSAASRNRRRRAHGRPR